MLVPLHDGELGEHWCWYPCMMESLEITGAAIIIIHFIRGIVSILVVNNTDVCAVGAGTTPACLCYRVQVQLLHVYVVAGGQVQLLHVCAVEGRYNSCISTL